MKPPKTTKNSSSKVLKASGISIHSVMRFSAITHLWLRLSEARQKLIRLTSRAWSLISASLTKSQIYWLVWTVRVSELPSTSPFPSHPQAPKLPYKILQTAKVMYLQSARKIQLYISVTRRIWTPWPRIRVHWTIRPGLWILMSRSARFSSSCMNPRKKFIENWSPSEW